MAKKVHTITFNGCKHLDYDDNYPRCRKDLLSIGHSRVVVFWDRGNKEYPSMVQFCKLRGRLNSPYACISKGTKRCNEYSEHEHTIDVEVEYDE